MWYVHIRNTTECKRSERCAQNISNAEPWGVEFGRCWWGGEHFHFKIVHTRKIRNNPLTIWEKDETKLKAGKGCLCCGKWFRQRSVGIASSADHAMQSDLRSRASKPEPGASRRPADLVGETRRWCKGRGVAVSAQRLVPRGWGGHPCALGSHCVASSGDEVGRRVRERFPVLRRGHHIYSGFLHSH